MTSAHPVTAVFRSHYSLCASLLTLEPPGKAKAGGPLSVFDLAKEGGLKEITIVDDRIDGAIAAIKQAGALGLQLCYGIRFVICADHTDKTLDSRRTESKVIVMMANTAGYSDLLKLWSRAWVDGHIRYRVGGDDYAYGRLDWNVLKAFWTPNLVLALPYTSSFIARNTLTFNQITPSLPAAPWLFAEQDSQLPFAPLIDKALARYVAQEPSAQVLPVKTVCYAKRSDMKAYTVLRAIGSGGTWEGPEVPHLCSDSWCWESYRELTAPPVVVAA